MNFYDPLDPLNLKTTVPFRNCPYFQLGIEMSPSVLHMVSYAGLTCINMIACSGYPDCMRVDMASTCIDMALAFVLP